MNVEGCSWLAQVDEMTLNKAHCGVRDNSLDAGTGLLCGPFPVTWATEESDLHPPPPSTYLSTGGQ